MGGKGRREETNGGEGREAIVHYYKNYYNITFVCFKEHYSLSRPPNNFTLFTDQTTEVTRGMVL